MTQRIQIQSDSPEQTQRLAASLARRLRAGDVIALEGELGAGKTVFVRGLAEGLGLNPASVSSPTFVIRHEYEKANAMPLVHIDAYRLNGPDDLEAIGWNELLDECAAVIAIEWPSRVKSALPANRIDVLIEHAGPHSRTITMDASEVLAERLQSMRSTWAAATGVRTMKCRKCGVPTDASSPAFPFCSERCRLADLGQWFNEGYRMTRPMKSDEEFED